MRDLGGLPTTDGAAIRPRRLIRSDNLQDLSPAAVETLVAEIGVTDIVDLRSETELHEEGPGPLFRVTALTHHHHSLLAEDGRRATAEEALAMPWTDAGDERDRDVAYWAGHYLGYLSDRPDSVSAALRVIATSTGATVVHCAAGKDRTGTVVGDGPGRGRRGEGGDHRRLRALGRAHRARSSPGSSRGRSTATPCSLGRSPTTPRGRRRWPRSSTPSGTASAARRAG